MPTPAKDPAKLTGHWTNEQIAARKEAQQQLERRFVRLTAPDSVKADSVALEHWTATVKRMKGITLLDNVDIDMLAVYCLGLSRLAQLRIDERNARAEGDDYSLNNTIKLIQAQERIVLTYAEKLGLTPAGRVRLAKQRAEEKPATEADDLYG